ncbi:NADH ubiquinone oxidoreductase subunit NDUFA12 domain protein [Metarhizium robertsii]|uniref:NADH dehydrogenase [ubiquinone] 1 alpha subcomplex subunit n=1 Tax=Metarhizium robertsii TaxID=568076 RepID=A0A014PK18_9HYPO|nr:NADH ubiquinone oxidoreductase subunit NDUFA12 domain protein [Metarhizium robertsii]
MSTLPRTLSNLRKVGIKLTCVGLLPPNAGTFCLPGRSIQRMNRSTNLVLPCNSDTKYGRLVGTDRAGNKFFENMEELPLRTRWVEYAKHDYDAAQIEPGWHAWISYSVDKPPTEDALIATGLRKFEKPYAIPNYTQTRAAFKTYSTTKPKVSAWEPVAAQRT